MYLQYIEDIYILNNYIIMYDYTSRLICVCIYVYTHIRVHMLYIHVLNTYRSLFIPSGGISLSIHMYIYESLSSRDPLLHTLLYMYISIVETVESIVESLYTSVPLSFLFACNEEINNLLRNAFLVI